MSAKFARRVDEILADYAATAEVREIRYLYVELAQKIDQLLPQSGEKILVLRSITSSAHLFTDAIAEGGS